MNTNGRAWEAEDFNRYQENRSKFPPEQLLPYAGLHVAWSADGTHILASAPDWQSLDEQLLALGLHAGEFVHGYVDALDGED